MKKQIIKIELNGKIIGTKPLILSDNLHSIRDKIKDKINVSYFFINKEGNAINNDIEKDYTLEKICEDKLIKIKSEQTNQSGISILLNGKIISNEQFSAAQNLNEIRNILKSRIIGEFIFLDQSDNPVDKNDEADYSLEDILDNNSIKLKGISNSTSLTIKDLRNKSKIKKNFNLSKYKILNDTNKNFIIYKYFNNKSISKYKDVYQYYVDEYSPLDDHNAYVVLFCGKTGDGKTTAINAFFNIIKGIEIDDPYRFILITEPEKKTGQAESQTDGVHIYYVKDYENKPVIIIDSQGYGDTRGKEYDDSLINSFKHIFSNVIDHINTALFIVKTNTNRIDVLTKYIFSSVTSLFSEDISENFLILATFCDKGTKTKGPAFVSSIQTDADFLKINKRMNDKWWYAIDSMSIFDPEKDNLTIYSFESAIELYEKKVKILRAKNIKNCAEVLSNRIELRIKIEKLTNDFQQLLVEQDNLEVKEKNLNETKRKLDEIESNIKNLNNSIEECDNPKALEKKLEEFNKEFEKDLDNLDNQVEEKKVKKLTYFEDTKCTHCDICENNCHEICDCFFSFIFHRCKIFTFFGKRCEICGCQKEDHKQDHYYYKYQKVDDSEEKEKNEKRKLTKIQKEEERKKIKEKLNKAKDQKTKLDIKLQIFEKNKNILEQRKNKNLKDKIETQEKINEKKKELFKTIIFLQRISKKLSEIAMNNSHIKNEEEYIDDLIKKMDQLDLKENERIDKMKKIKKSYQLYKKALALKEQDLYNLDDARLTKLLKDIKI